MLIYDKEYSMLKYPIMLCMLRINFSFGDSEICAAPKEN